MNNNIIETMQALEAMGYSKEQIVMLMTGKKAKAGKGNAEKSVDFKVKYDHFEKQFDGFKAVSVASNSGNPDAVLTVNFDNQPDDKVRNYLKGCGFKWNAEKSVWYRNNVDFAQKALDLVSIVK